MKIQMLETRRGTDDGLTVRQYHKDSIYRIPQDMGDTLACMFLQSRFAQRLKEGEAA